MASLFRLTCTSALAVLIAAPALAAGYKVPRTRFGHPDLQGEWTNLSFTPLVRPKEFKALTTSDAEAAAYIGRVKNRFIGIKPPPDPDAPKPKTPPEPDVGDVESEWYPEMETVGFARIDGQLRTSWIVEPADGKLPYSEAGKAAAKAGEDADESDFRGPEVRLADERCLTSFGSVSGPPMLNSSYNSNYKIIQTPTEVAIFVEMIHDVRIVRLHGQHPARPTPKWNGDSIGWWEGDTLVVETVDQPAAAANRILASGSFHISPAARITERFTRTSPTQIRYRFTVDDPAIYTRPWRGEMVLNATDAPLYEYACHEGNYALPNILGGAREQERAASARPATK
jgi:hypothetical protein